MQLVELLWYELGMQGVQAVGKGQGVGRGWVPLHRGLESKNSWGSMPAMGLPVMLRTLSIPAHSMTSQLNVLPQTHSCWQTS